jgi:hypothetical protein
MCTFERYVGIVHGRSSLLDGNTDAQAPCYSAEVSQAATACDKMHSA